MEHIGGLMNLFHGAIVMIIERQFQEHVLKDANRIFI